MSFQLCVDSFEIGVIILLNMEGNVLGNTDKGYIVPNMGSAMREGCE